MRHNSLGVEGRLYENHVRARFLIRNASIDCSIEPFDDKRISPRDDQKFLITSRVYSCTHLFNHFVAWNERLASEMPATLGP